MVPVRCVDTVLGHRRRVTVYTDASAEVRPPRVLQTVSLCYVAFWDDGRKSGGVAELPDDIIMGFSCRFAVVGAEHGWRVRRKTSIRRYGAFRCTFSWGRVDRTYEQAPH